MLHQVAFSRIGVFTKNVLNGNLVSLQLLFNDQLLGEGPAEPIDLTYYNHIELTASGHFEHLG
ncbi:MAG: hypothetical protein R6X16_12330 [Anaerolineae bacterium]